MNNDPKEERSGLTLFGIPVEVWLALVDKLFK